MFYFADGLSFIWFTNRCMDALEAIVCKTIDVNKPRRFNKRFALITSNDFFWEKSKWDNRSYLWDACVNEFSSNYFIDAF